MDKKDKKENLGYKLGYYGGFIILALIFTIFIIGLFKLLYLLLFS